MRCKQLALLPAVFLGSSLLTLSAGCLQPEFEAGPFVADDGRQYADTWGDQSCVLGDLSTRLFNAGLAALVARRPDASRMRNFVARVCYTPEPVPCTASGLTVYYDGIEPPDGVNQRVAGCAAAGSFWAVQVSLNWPPVCRPEWPGEKYCVSDASNQQRQAYWNMKTFVSTSAHELINLYALYILRATEEMAQEVQMLHLQDQGGLWDAIRSAMFAEFWTWKDEQDGL